MIVDLLREGTKLKSFTPKSPYGDFNSRLQFVFKPPSGGGGGDHGVPSPENTRRASGRAVRY